MTCLAICLCKITLSHLGWLIAIWFLFNDIYSTRMIKVLSRRFGLWHLGPINDDIGKAFHLNPESETVEWLNFILKQVWDLISKYLQRSEVNNVLNNEISGIWNAKVPNWLKYYIKSPPYIQTMKLGNQKPWITSIKTYDHEDYERCLAMDIGIVFHINPDIKLAFNKFLIIGLSQLKFNTTFRIVIAPILKDLTTFGEIQISILKKPDINFETFGILGFLSWPFVQPLITSAVNEILLKIINSPDLGKIL